MKKPKPEHTIQHTITTPRGEFNIPLEFQLWKDGTVTWKRKPVKLTS